MKTECRCKATKNHKIYISEYGENNMLELQQIEVCDSCKVMYDSLGLSLTDFEIEKYFGQPISTESNS